MVQGVARRSCLATLAWLLPGKSCLGPGEGGGAATAWLLAAFCRDLARILSVLGEGEGGASQGL